MAHVLIIGVTESGKTTLAKRLAFNLKKKGKGVIVLDPQNNRDWHADFMTKEYEEFMSVVKASRRCFLIIDEAGINCHQWAKNDSQWLGTQARHWGHSSIFIAQRAIQIDKTIRDQCSFLYLFACGKKDCELHADEWNKERLLEAKTLLRGEYFYASRFGEVKRFKLF